MNNTDHRLLTSEHAPYEAFWEGFVDFRHGLHHNPYDAAPAKETEAQSWDHGQEAAMRVERAAGRASPGPRAADGG
jgi:hypothetical protein